MNRHDFMDTFFFKKRHRLDNVEFDAYVADDLKKATKRAKQILGVTDEFVNAFNPLIVSTPVKAQKNFEPVIVYGEDKLRFDLGLFTAMFFGENMLFYSATVIDHKTGSSFNDRLLEFSYSQIKGIETISKFTYINEQEHHVFQIRLYLKDLDDLVIPLRVLLVDPQTAKDEYLLPAHLLGFATEFKSFIKSKMVL